MKNKEVILIEGAKLFCKRKRGIRKSKSTPVPLNACDHITLVSVNNP